LISEYGVPQGFIANKIRMNADKIKYMVVRSVRKELRRNITLKCLDGTEIKRVEIMKYLRALWIDGACGGGVGLSHSGPS